MIRLRFLTTAFKYRNRAAIAYIKIHDKNSAEVIKRFGVPTSSQTDTLLLFQENPDVPVASVSMKDLSIKTIFEVIDSHQFLQLPRLSNQDVFDALCPAESSRMRKRLCVTLMSTGEQEEHRQSMREFVQDYKFSPERVRFTYILLEKQADFVRSLVSASNVEPALRVAIMWRRDVDKIKFEWLDTPWEFTPEKVNASRDSLR